MRIVTFKTHLESRDVNFRESLWASCLPPMALSSRLSAMLNCGLFILQLGMNQNIDDPNHLAKRSSMLPTSKQLVHLLCVPMGNSNSLIW
jgi:hypothetical protein